MAFRDYPDFKVTIDAGTRKPKGMPRRKGMKADRLPIRGDLSTTTKIEASLWLRGR